MATPMQIATAAAVPTQTWRRASLRPCWPRKAAMIPTIRAASSPSRSPITNVGSTSRPLSRRLRRTDRSSVQATRCLGKPYLITARLVLSSPPDLTQPPHRPHTPPPAIIVDRYPPYSAGSDPRSSGAGADAHRAARRIYPRQPVRAQVHGPARDEPNRAGPGQEPPVLAGLQPGHPAELPAAQH